MECFKVERIDTIDWIEDYAMVVIAKDELHAEKCARLNSSDFKKAKLKVTKIDMNTEQVVLVANTGA